MAAIYSNFQGGVTLQDLGIGDTTVLSGAFASLPPVDAPDYMWVTLDPLSVFGPPEVIKITHHDTAANVVTVERGQQQDKGGFPPRFHPLGTYWESAGTAYDLTLLVPGRARSIRRACDDAEVGQAADILEPVLRAALGHDPRFDVIFPGGGDFSAARSAYAALVRDGGTLKADPDARRQPPGAEPAPEPEAPPG